MTRSISYLIIALALVAPSVVAQTTGVPGVNDMTINGQGSGGTSCIPVHSVAGDPWNVAVSTYPFSPLVGVLANNCQPDAISINATYSVDLDPVSAEVVLDGTGALVNNGLTPLMTANSFGNWTFGVTTQELFNVSVGFQMGFVNVTFPNGVGTSQSYDVTFGPINLVPNGMDLSPLSDDGSINVAFASTPFTFYGTTYSDVYVNMNGNLTFTSGDTDWTSSGSEMVNGAPRIAPAWDDWTPNDSNQGTVRASDDGLTFAVEWYNVRHYSLANCGGNTDSNTFAVFLDLTTGEIEFGYGTMMLCQQGSAPSSDQVVGISPGASAMQPLNNIDITAGYSGLPNQPIYEDFGLSTYGDFDLSHLTCCFGQVVHFAPVGLGYAESLQ